ncbi:sensor histidine kinase [Oryzifoliimicrobium ureilyticus]|uniref:sensor histidine kinase n=1 Tax=Oryzifoliimicrobium ureilyticus TaxID=3113724 RepID=UPI0030763A63
MTFTLSQRLFFRILPTLIIAIAVVGVFAYRSAIREINNIYDAQLISDANVLWSLLGHRLERPRERPTVHVPDIDFSMDNQLALNEDADDFADAHSYRLWKGDTLAIASSNAFPDNIPQFHPGFAETQYDGSTWRIYSLAIPNSEVTIEVAEDISLREQLVENILLNLAFPLLILIPAIAALIWYGITDGLSNIRGLVRQIRSRNPDDLTKISSVALPKDLTPLVGSLNTLLEKLERSLASERRFSDLAAHQLRTPHAAIKLLLQLLAQADTEEERQSLINDLVSSNERSMHMIEQLLKLARIGHEKINLAPVNLYDIAASTLADFGNLISLKNFEVELVGDETAQGLTDAALLRLMLDNVLDNAIKYAPEGGRLEVSVRQEDSQWLISIADNGPGIPAEEREAAFQRFNRLKAIDRQGVGLGLAIVADIAARLGTEIKLDTPSWGRGLQFSLYFPKV